MSSARELASVIWPVDRYVMSMMGMTISLAGSPRMNASRMMPSKPRYQANGSRNRAMCCKRLASEITMLAKSQITAPAGAAMMTARLRTNKVRSMIER